MSINPKRFQRMTPDQRERYMRNTMKAHKNIAVAGVIGQAAVLLTIASLAIHWGVA